MNKNLIYEETNRNLKKAMPWYRRSFYKKKHESELENQKFLSAVYEISKKFNLDDARDKKKFYDVAYKYRNIKNISDLESKIICDLVSEGVFLPWINKKEKKLLKTWFKNKIFAAVARTENILKNIFSMHRVQNFDPIKAIRNMKDEYSKSLGNGKIRVLSNQEISQLLNLNLDNLLKEDGIKKIMPFDYENLSDTQKSKIRAEYLSNAIDSYCSGSNMSGNDILQNNNDLNKFYYISQSYTPKFFSKQDAGKYKASFDNMIKNIDKIHESLRKVKADKAKRRDSITNLDIFDTLIKIYGFEKINSKSPVEYKFIGTDDKSMDLTGFQKGEIIDSNRLMSLIPCSYKNIEAFLKLHFENEKLAAVTFLEHPEKIEGISFNLRSGIKAKTFWNNVFDFMKLDNKYKDKKQDIIKAVYSLPDTSRLKQEFIKSQESIALIGNYLVKELKFGFGFGFENYFRDKDFKEIVTNGLVLKNILLASRAANKDPLEFIKTQKNIYIENHEGQELSNSEIRILLDFDFLNDKQCKKVIPIKTDNLSNEIKNDLSGEYILNAFNAYASTANTLSSDYDNYLISYPDKRKIFYLANGIDTPFSYDSAINEARITNKSERMDFTNFIFEQTLEDYDNIILYVKENCGDAGADQLKDALTNYMYNKNGKNHISKMFKEKTTVIENGEESKVIDLVDSLEFTQSYANFIGFNALHSSNLKLACIGVLQNPQAIVDVKSKIDKQIILSDCKEFSVCLINMISKQESYKSKIPEILSYLDPESDMAKNIVDLAVKKNIYDKIESKSESDIKKARALTVDLKNKNTEEKPRSLTIKNKKSEPDTKKFNPLSGKLNNVKKLVSFFENKSDKNINKQPKKNKGDLR